MSFFQLAEQYFVLVRRISRLHGLILDKHSITIDGLVSKIDAKMSEYGNAKSLSSKDLLDFRMLVFQLQDLLDLTIMDEYNQLLDKVSVEAIAEEKELNLETKPTPSNSEHTDVWADLKEFLKANMNESAFDVWVEPSSFLEVKDNEIRVKVDNFFYKRFLEENCSPLIRKYIDEHRLSYNVKFVA